MLEEKVQQLKGQIADQAGPQVRRNQDRLSSSRSSNKE